MQVSIHNKVRVYDLTVGKSLPEWLSERRKNKLKAGGEHRIELIHELEFPDFARCMFRTPNGTHIFAAGDYPPRIKCFDVNQLSQKFSFNADMPILSGVSLSPDFRKFALRGEGRQLTIHHTAHIIDRVRVPHTQRGLAYDQYHAELLSPGVSHEIFRLNLETGAFVESYKTQCEKGVNHVDVFEGHGLIVAACENGTLEAWDSRQAKRAGVVATAAAVTHVCCDRGGLIFAAGTAEGEVNLFDVRLQKPILIKDHMNSLPIVKTYFFQGKSATTGESTHILTADTRSVKVWNKADGSNFTTLEAPAPISDFLVLKAEHNLASPYECDDSGVICIACDTPKVQVQFVPQLGVAPRWAAFLDTVVEELEEKPTSTVYEDFRFVTKEEMDKMGLKPEDIHDGRVRPAMHGCFIENSFYREVQAVVDPQAFNRKLKESAKGKKAARTEDRISKFKRVEGSGGEAEAGSGALADPRFARALKSEAFAVDKNNPEYVKLLAKIEEKRVKAAERAKKYEAEQFREVGGAEARDAESEPDAAGSSDDERRLEATELRTKARALLDAKKAKAGSGGGDRQVKLLEAKEGINFALTDRQTHAQRKRERHKQLSLEERLKKTARQ